MADPQVIQMMYEFKRALLQAESRQQQEMTRRWLQIERRLRSQIDALAMEIERKRKAGELITQGSAFRLERFHTLLAQAQMEIMRYQAWAEDEIKRGQERMLETGISQASEIIAAAMTGAGVTVAFNRINVSAVEFMAGLTADGSPLFDVLQKRALYPEAVQGLIDSLVNATAQGWNPRKTASRMKDGLAQGLQKALTIARTEQMRALRTASVAEYRESGVVVGFMRLSAKSLRTCPACLARDGEVFALRSDFFDHVSGRCSVVPILEGQLPKPSWKTGKQWFLEQKPAVQEAIMGKGHYAAWKAGKFQFEDLAQTTHSDVWGDSLRVRALKDLLREMREDLAAG